ncbi:MAG TPA: hypothetical protein VFD27_09380, partial [Chthoniobacteraceae bacterium]|nr:hypothetical protein [Chthoniobacteraceae bacterium]
IRTALILALALQLVGCAMILKRSTPKQEEAQRSESQLQLRVMRFADGYADAVSRACAQAQSEATDSRLRYRLVDFQIKQATAAVQIAAGSNPSINAVDMVVLASLTRASVAHNLTEVMGSKAQPLIETFARLEKGAWYLVDFLTPAQHADLSRRLAAWAPDAASLDSVAYNRLADFAKASGLPGDEQSPASSVLALIGADPLAGLHPGVREIQRSRILGERAIYYAERTPMLLDLQTRALSAAVVDMPEARSVLATAFRIGESAALFAETTAKLPETFSKEREATIEQLLTAMEQQQGTMKELVVEIRQSLEAGHDASDSIQRVLDTVRSLKVAEPPPPGSVPGRPFDVTEYTQAAETIGDAAKQLEALFASVNSDVPAATHLGEIMRDHGEYLIDHLYDRVIRAFGVLFIGVLLIVLASRLLVAHLRRRAERRTSAGGNVR